MKTIHNVSGIRLASISAKIKKNGTDDLVAVEISEGSTVAAVFTQNAFCAAPVQVSKQHFADHSARFLIINSGNANAGTGERGLNDVREICEMIGLQAGCKPQEVLCFSTGVIGEYLPVEKIRQAFPVLYSGLTDGAWQKAAEGIMTTDTRPKLVSKQIKINGETVTITGMAKGVGMICPNMATLLAFIATDASIEKNLLSLCLQQAVAQSFNRITVDGDTSTNDSCVLIATGQSQAQQITDQNKASYQQIRHAIVEVCVELAKDLVRDGEGATKLVTINVDGGKTKEECDKVAYTIAHSPLVKTALFAADPNWGRILAAIGRSGLDNLDVNKVGIKLDDVEIARNGGRSPQYQEADAKKVLDKSEYSIGVDLGRGNESAQIWTCDLSYDYVKINAEYRS